jgi:transposase
MKTKRNERNFPVRYPDYYKEKVCREYLETGVSISYLREKYKIAGHNSISLWLEKFGFKKTSRVVDGKVKAENILAMQHKEQKSAEELRKRIKVLERDLEDAQLKAEAYSRMIDIAEKELKIQIRKKFDTK